MAGTDDAHLDAILFNGAVRLHLSGRTQSLEAGLELAREIVGSGRAMAKLREMRG